MLRGLVAGAAAAALLAGCASGVPALPAGSPSPSVPSPATRSPDTPGPDGRVAGRGTVLDDGSGPEFCLGGVAQSLPPQCGGPRLAGWTWPDDASRQSGVTWTDAALLGTFDGHRFTVGRSLTAAEVARLFPRPHERDLTSPCPEPVGGWRAPDPRRAASDDEARVFAAAERLPGFAESWLDDRGDHRQLPERIVVDVRVTGDLGAAEQRLREVWGGSLCVTRAERTQAELSRIQTTLMRRPGVLTTSTGGGHVDLEVVHDDGSLQAELDQRYGAGLVEVTSALVPYRQ